MLWLCGKEQAGILCHRIRRLSVSVEFTVSVHVRIKQA